MKTNIVLIGMAGCGKSIVGRKVAGRLNFIFLDSDAALEIALRKKVETLIGERGEEEFLRLEAEHLLEFMNPGVQNFVISTGGSIVLLDETMRRLKQAASIVFLDTPFELIEERVKDGRTRTAAIIGLRQKGLKQVYEERLPLYEKYADWRLPTGNFSEEWVVEKIAQWWCRTNRGICADA